MPATTLRSLAFCWLWISASRALRSWLARLFATGSSGSFGGGSRRVYVARLRTLSPQRATLAPCPRPPRRPACWRPGRPTAVGLIVSAFRRGGGDPTFQPDRRRRVVAGPADARRARDPAARPARRPRRGGRDRLGCRGASGPSTRCPALLGEGDDDSDFVAHHPQVATRLEAVRRVARAPLRPGDARARARGDRAEGDRPGGVRLATARSSTGSARGRPGPGEQRRLWVAADGRQWAAIPSWDWLRRVGRRRAVRRPSCGRRGSPAGSRRRRTCRSTTRTAGCARCRASGVWTAAEVAQRALGDADSVSFGDYHVAKNLTWALLGEARDDDVLAELLEPYRGHRYRVQHLLELVRRRPSPPRPADGPADPPPDPPLRPRRRDAGSAARRTLEPHAPSADRRPRRSVRESRPSPHRATSRRAPASPAGRRERGSRRDDRTTARRCRPRRPSGAEQGDRDGPADAGVDGLRCRQRRSRARSAAGLPGSTPSAARTASARP